MSTVRAICLALRPTGGLGSLPRKYFSYGVLRIAQKTKYVTTLSVKLFSVSLDSPRRRSLLRPAIEILVVSALCLLIVEWTRFVICSLRLIEQPGAFSDFFDPSGFARAAFASLVVGLALAVVTRLHSSRQPSEEYRHYPGEAKAGDNFSQLDQECHPRAVNQDSAPSHAAV
jgi:hypothetical protein